MSEPRVAMSIGRISAVLVLLGAPSGALAQRTPRVTAGGDPLVVATPTHEWRYLEGAHERVIAVDAHGAMWLVANGRRFRAALGTDRVIVVGDVDALAGADVHVDEVLSARAGIVAVRSTRVGEGPLALASRLAPLVASGRLEAASPDLALAHVQHDIAVPPNDPRYGGQWFYRTIRMEDAWARQDGDPGVTIAVIDNGCDTTHPDLAAHMLPGYDALEDDDDPSFLPGARGNEHGTACAGLAAAVTDNGLDVAGTCPECALRCIRLLGAPGTLIPISSDIRAFEFVLAHEDVAVVSNSWGFEAGAPAPLALVREIQTVMTDARGGRGALVVFAAGNDAQVIGDDELQAIPGVLTVGAINTFDEAASFSNSGACVALVAPTGTLTTDVSGPEGSDPGGVTTSFGGTSSACPIVAGVGGLLASAAPTLTAAELREALVASVRPAPFATPDETGHDLLYGFGIVDPSAALDRIDPRPTDAGRDDVGPSTEDAGAGTLPASGGCGCRVGTSPSTRVGLAALFAMALGLVALRRRWRGRPFFARPLLARPLLARLSLALGILPLTSLAGCAAEPSEARPTVAALRPDTPDTTELPPRYDATDVVESIVSPAGSFRVHFTRAGRHAVPLADADADGTPDHVALVAATYDAVLARYVGMGFRAPRSDEDVPDDNGGDGLFDVYLVDFGGGSDGAFRRELCRPDGCTGYMIQENDFAGSGYPSVSYGVRLLASHELFHAVQAAYDDGLGVQGSVLSEGTAVWASERFDPTLSDLERLAYGYTSRTDRSLGVDPVTAGGAYTYGAGIFFEHLGVQFGDAIVRELWEDLAVAEADAAWLVVLDRRLRTSHGSSFEASFLALAEWMVFLGARADAAHGPVNGREYEPVAAMLVEAPFVDTTVRMFPASIRYFVVQRGALTVSLGGAQAAEIDVLAVAFDGTRFVATERARGGVTIDAPGADLTFVALVDGRTTGSSRVVSLCIAEDTTDCTAEADAGALADAGLGDAGLGGDDAGAIPPPASSCACRATSGPQRTTPSLVALAALAGLVGRRRRRG